MPRLIKRQIIYSKSSVGEGVTSDPSRFLEEYSSPNGNLLVTHDTFTEETRIFGLLDFLRKGEEDETSN